MISNQIFEDRKNPESEKLYKRARSLENAGILDDAEQIYNQIFLESLKIKILYVKKNTNKK